MMIMITMKRPDGLSLVLSNQKQWREVGNGEVQYLKIDGSGSHFVTVDSGRE